MHLCKLDIEELTVVRFKSKKLWRVAMTYTYILKWLINANIIML
jgi:hypothetical protein